MNNEGFKEINVYTIDVYFVNKNQYPVIQLLLRENKTSKMTKHL